MKIYKQDFDCEMGYGYIETIDRGDERNITQTVVVEGTYGYHTEEEIEDYITNEYL